MFNPAAYVVIVCSVFTLSNILIKPHQEIAHPLMGHYNNHNHEELIMYFVNTNTCNSNLFNL